MFASVLRCNPQWRSISFEWLASLFRILNVPGSSVLSATVRRCIGFPHKLQADFGLVPYVLFTALWLLFVPPGVILKAPHSVTTVMLLVINQGCTSIGRQDIRATKFCTLAPIIYGSSFGAYYLWVLLWRLLFMGPPLAPIIYGSSFGAYYLWVLLWRLLFMVLLWRLLFMGPRCGTCFTSHFWRPDFLVNLCTPSVNSRNLLTQHWLIGF